MTSRPETVAKLIEDHIRGYDIGCGEDYRIQDAIAHARKEKDIGGALEIIQTISAWAAADILTAIGPPVAQLGAASPEPVAWRWRYDNQFWAFRSTRPKHADDVDVTCEPLYTHPPASPPTGDDCSCGGGDISGHDALCPERSQEERGQK